MMCIQGQKYIEQTSHISSHKGKKSLYFLSGVCSTYFFPSKHDICGVVNLTFWLIILKDTILGKF